MSARTRRLPHWDAMIDAGLTQAEAARALGMSSSAASAYAERARAKFRRRAAERVDDERALQVLDLHHGCGMSFKDTAETLGITRCAVAGIVKRIRDAEAPCHCEKPENQDGGMPAGWWKK